jgi:hypothetical protein
MLNFLSTLQFVANFNDKGNSERYCNEHGEVKSIHKTESSADQPTFFLLSYTRQIGIPNLFDLLYITI